MDLCGNSSHGNQTLGYQLADLHHLIAGSLVYFLTLPFVLFHFRCFPVGSTPAVLLGALMMVITQVVSQEEAYAVMGRRENMTPVFMLLGMMLLGVYVEREQLLVRLLRCMLTSEQRFTNYIWRVCVLSFLLSAVFSSDASCAILTPIIVKSWDTQDRARTELETILLAVATSANIGSVCTVFGNPQMALLAAHTQDFMQGRLDMRSCFMYLLPAALVGLLLNIGFLVLHQWIKTRRIEKSKLISEPSHSEQEMAGLTKTNSPPTNHTNGFLKVDSELMYEGLQTLSCDRLAMPTSLETIKEDEVLEITENRGVGTIDIEAQERELVLHSSSDSDSDSDQESTESSTRGTSEDLRHLDASTISAYCPNQLTQLAALQEQHPPPLQSPQVAEQQGLLLLLSRGVYKTVGALSAADFLPPDTGLHQLSPAETPPEFSGSDSLAFHLNLVLAVLAVLLLLLASNAAATFDIGLVPLGAAVFVLAADAVLNRRSGVTMMRRMDWSVLLGFPALYVWIRGFSKTGLVQSAWSALGLAGADLSSSPQHLALLAALVLAGSCLLGGGVPTTLLLLDAARCHHRGALLPVTLAWLLTLATNLTLYSSSANLIVVHKAVHSLKFRLTFWGHLQFTFLTTIIISLVGMLVIYTLLLIPV